MECLTDIKLHLYAEGELNSVESAMVRDHLIVCQSCNAEYEFAHQLEKHLLEPVEMIPPAMIERNVMNLLFPKLPSYSSILALIAASFVLLVTSIYIYFDFANNSIVQALQMTSNTTSNWIGSIVSFIYSVFSSVYSVFKVLNRFIEIVFQINLGAEIVGLTVFIMFSLIFYSIFRLALKKLKN